MQGVYVRCVRGKDILAVKEQEVLGHGTFKAYVAIQALLMALMDVHIFPHLAGGFLSLLWVDSVVAPPLLFWL